MVQFCLLDPDPYIEYRSGSRRRFEFGSTRIRLQNTGTGTYISLLAAQITFWAVKFSLSGFATRKVITALFRNPDNVHFPNFVNISMISWPILPNFYVTVFCVPESEPIIGNTVVIP